MSNFNLRLLLTFSFSHRSSSVGGLVPPLLSLVILFWMSAFAKATADDRSTNSKLTSKG